MSQKEPTDIVRAPTQQMSDMSIAVDTAQTMLRDLRRENEQAWQKMDEGCGAIDNRIGGQDQRMTQLVDNPKDR